jgi:hypothetical protein
VDKIINIGSGNCGQVFCHITFKEGRLSITGVEGPKANGGARGGCGQIIMSGWDITTYAKGWDAELEAKFIAVWERWHLNDMKAGTPAQEQFLRDTPIGPCASHYLAALAALTAAGLNPDNGYKYGSAWLREEVPEDVIAFLVALPVTRINPAWV